MTTSQPLDAQDWFPPVLRKLQVSNAKTPEAYADAIKDLPQEELEQEKSLVQGTLQLTRTALTNNLHNGYDGSETTTQQKKVVTTQETKLRLIAEETEKRGATT